VQNIIIILLIRDGHKEELGQLHQLLRFNQIQVLSIYGSFWIIHNRGDTVNVFYTGAPFTAPSPPPPGVPAFSGVVASYVGTTLTITFTSGYGGTFSNFSYTSWLIVQTNLGHVTSWHTAIGNYPSNADVWWRFKDTSNVFNPTATVANVTLSSSKALQDILSLTLLANNVAMYLVLQVLPMFQL